MEEFSIGDVVILKSDLDNDFPLLMTVNGIDGDNISCIWRVREEFKGQTFHRGTLTHYQD